MAENTTTTAAAIDTTELTFPGTPTVTDNRAGFNGELARLRSELDEAHALLEEHKQLVTQLRTEQITDGADPRLVNFWDKAGRIADHADFCEEYDRLAEAMNGTPRERQWYVEAEVTVTVRVSYSTYATTSDDAEDNARDSLDFDDVLEAYRTNGHDSFDIEILETERA